MYDINLICDHVITILKKENNVSLSFLKLQKILYYIQAWHLAFYEKPLFEGKFQAWIHGPVNRVIYDRYKNTKYSFSEINESDIINPNCSSLIDLESKSHIDNVLGVYAQYSGVELEHLTHQEVPWNHARKGLMPYLSSETIIDEAIMTNYYKNLSGSSNE